MMGGERAGMMECVILDDRSWKHGVCDGETMKKECLGMPSDAFR